MTCARCGLTCLLLIPMVLVASAQDLSYHPKGSFSETLVALRATAHDGSIGRADVPEEWNVRLNEDFPVETDWWLQDGGPDCRQWVTAADGAEAVRGMVDRVLDELGERGETLRQEVGRLRERGRPDDEAPWLDLYLRAAARRRAIRLETTRALAPKVVFTKHRTIRPSFFAYTEGQSDAQHERHFLPGSQLCLLEWEGEQVKVRVLLADPQGAIRDPAVSWNGRCILFAWKKSLDGDDYHLYELDAASGAVRHITSGLGFADYEPAYLPNGDIVFSSTRCVQTVDCWWTEVSNLYTCDGNGRYLRRLGFDQVHTVFPTVLEDGRVIYTRWDYNDRGQVYPQALFQMHPDGTGQTEFYGNGSWFPTTIAHARGIPGTQKVVAILCGHHSTQAGKLAVIDPAKGRQENSGVQLVAPERETRAERVDAYGQVGELFQYPFPLGGSEFLVGFAPRGWVQPAKRDRRKGDAAFGIYWLDSAGRRELLVSDREVACQQPVPLVVRPRPVPRPSLVDPRKADGTFYVQDIYAGMGLAGVPRGTVKKIRVVALDFRPAGVGNNGSRGPGGGALISTPVAIGNGSWDVKIVLGEAQVCDDGSAFFVAPARTPVYFQALDAKGRALQTMRSWATLQPGENQSCVGCHEHKNMAPPTEGYRGRLALKAGPQVLAPFYGPPRGFSFQGEIQPILDRHCVECHGDRQLRMEAKQMVRPVHREVDPDWLSALASLPAALQGGAPPISPAVGVPGRTAFSLRGDATTDRLAKRHWSDAYLNLTLAQPANNDWDRGSFGGQCDGAMVNWVGSQSIPSPLPPCAAGSIRSALLPLLEGGHGGVRLAREELEKIACWIDLLVPYCGDYAEANDWTDEEIGRYQRYLDKRRRMEAEERRNIEALIRDRGPAG